MPKNVVITMNVSHTQMLVEVEKIFQEEAQVSRPLLTNHPYHHTLSPHHVTYSGVIGQHHVTDSDIICPHRVSSVDVIRLHHFTSLDVILTDLMYDVIRLHHV